ncbi:MAG: helix-turn-helix domain-containing protein [Haloarculaceae archaeon]
MESGIRAEVRVDAPANCPIARASRETGADSHAISKTAPPDGETVVEEFMLDSAVEPGPDPDEVEAVFSYGGQRVYRFERERGRGCACERVEQFGCPVVDIYTRDGGLYLTFHAASMAALQDVVEALRATYDGVDVRRLLHSAGDRAEHDLVFVDRGDLTDRQREVIETAHDMGYFDHPKGANASEVAAALGIARSTFSEHLSAAQRKLLDAILDA